MTTLVHDAKNTIKRIDAIWMVVSIDKEDNTEGICAMTVGDMQMPLIAADEARLPFIREKAQFLARTSGKRIAIIRLSTRDVIEEFYNDGDSVAFQ